MATTGLITTLDEFEAEFRKNLGMTYPPTPWKEANLDNIRRFGDGVGDFNPLWRDEEYAKNGPLWHDYGSPNIHFCQYPRR